MSDAKEANISDLETAVQQALDGVIDPELRLPITQLGMVQQVEITPAPSGNGALVLITLKLTIPGCPMRDRLRADIQNAIDAVPGVLGSEVKMSVMTDEDRAAVREQLRARRSANDPAATARLPHETPANHAAAPQHHHEPARHQFLAGRTKVYAISSGKGGVGKSTVAANLAVALAQLGLSVGVVDADIHGFSIPRMLGTGEEQPTKIDELLIPPTAHGVKVISIGMFVEPGHAVVWRGPVMHRALTQFLTDVYWGDLDVLLLDLPPGTGDVAISVAQLLPDSELVLVTTPQLAAAEVAERAGSMAAQTRQHVAGVIENMAWFEAPDGQRLELFGAGGGERVAESLTNSLGYPVTVLGQVPVEPAVRVGGDSGQPVVLSAPTSPAANAFRAIAKELAPFDPDAADLAALRSTDDFDIIEALNTQHR